jgi:hypothetical protein
MPANAEIDFRFDQMEWVEQAKSWGRAEALAQASQTGILGGAGGVGLNGPNQYGLTQGFWRGVNGNMFALARPVIFFSLAAVIIGYFVKISVLLMFGFAWLLWTFIFHNMMFMTESGSRYLMYSTLPRTALLGGLMLSAVLVFFGYRPLYESGELSQSDLTTFGISGGVAVFLIMAYFGMKSTKPLVSQAMNGATQGPPRPGSTQAVGGGIYNPNGMATKPAARTTM